MTISNTEIWIDINKMQQLNVVNVFWRICKILLSRHYNLKRGCRETLNRIAKNCMHVPRYLAHFDCVEFHSITALLLAAIGKFCLAVSIWTIPKLKIENRSIWNITFWKIAILETYERLRYNNNNKNNSRSFSLQLCLEIQHIFLNAFQLYTFYFFPMCWVL